MTNELDSLPAPVSAVHDLDLDAWIDGTCRVTTTAVIPQRGDLLPEIERLERELEVVKKVPAGERGMNDPTPDTLAAELDRLKAEWLNSSMTVYIQDRTEERRRKIRDRLKGQGMDWDKVEDQDTIILHWIADSIVKIERYGVVKDLGDDGFPVQKLRTIRDRLGDAALVDTRDAFFRVISEAPTVSAPLSRRSSSARGGIT